MSEDWHGVCPHCQHRLHIHGRHTDGAHITCPGCHTSFTIPAAPPIPPAARAAGGRGKKLAALAILAGCALLGVVTLVLVVWASAGRKEEPSSQRLAQGEPSSAVSPQAPDSRKEANSPPPPRMKPSDQPPVDDTPPPLPAPQPTPRPKPEEEAPAKPEPIKWLPPEEQTRVDRALARGVAWLRKTQQADGSWEVGRGFNQGGRTALAALSLLHSGVSPRDPAVRNAADYLRRQVADSRVGAPGETTYRSVYVSTLIILFLDRLGDRRDEEIIRTLSVALIKGQMPSGKWTYSCPNLSAEAEQSVLERLRKSRPVPPWELFNEYGGMVETGSTAVRGSVVMGGGDYSNTQFAVMGLWAAARHQVPPQQALARTVRRFRQTQAANGGWGYEDGKAPYLSMTAAALYGLAVGHGLTHADTKESLRDSALDKGMKDLGSIDDWIPVTRKSIMVEDGSGVVIDGSLNRDFPYYALWSVERTAVIYNAWTIGGREWYAPGVRLLLDAQKANGCWKTHNFIIPPVVPTSFALLFLGRADVAPELTRTLRYVEKDGRMVLVKSPDKSLQRLFSKSSSAPLESDVTAPSRKEKAKRKEIEKPANQGRADDK